MLLFILHQNLHTSKIPMDTYFIRKKSVKLKKRHYFAVFFKVFLCVRVLKFERNRKNVSNQVIFNIIFISVSYLQR